MIEHTNKNKQGLIKILTFKLHQLNDIPELIFSLDGTTMNSEPLSLTIKLYKKEENWIDENQIEEEEVIEEEVIVEPQPIINPEIKNLENELVKVQKSGLIEKRRNEGAKNIQTQINKLKKDEDEKTITY